MLELHVWGPAFGLPSIDPECIAAIAYLHREVPSEDWCLVQDHDVSVTPSNRFPALHDGEAWIAGFEPIVKHLRDRSAGLTDMDSSLDPAQQADVTAFTSFLHAHALPALDLYLYVSYTNYAATTRPAYTKILPWHANYHIPPTRRDAARARTAHLGISGLDLDTYDEPVDLGLDTGHTPSGTFEAQKQAAGLPTDAPARPSLFARNRGVRSWLAKPEYASRFKLEQVAEALFAPLTELLARKPYLIATDAPTTLDCLAFGYLALILHADVPQPWLAEALKRKYPSLEQYTHRLHSDLLPSPSALRWQPPARHSIRTFLHPLYTRLPLAAPIIRRPAHDADPSFGWTRAAWLPLLSSTALALVAGLTYYSYRQQWSRPRRAVLPSPYGFGSRFAGEDNDLLFLAPRRGGKGGGDGGLSVVGAGGVEVDAAEDLLAVWGGRLGVKGGL